MGEPGSQVDGQATGRPTGSAVSGATGAGSQFRGILAHARAFPPSQAAVRVGRRSGGSARPLHLCRASTPDLPLAHRRGMTLLVDTNVFLEVLLNQARAEEACTFLSQADIHDFFIS